MREQLKFSTPDFADFSAPALGRFNAGGDSYEFERGHFAHLRTDRLKTGELKWADAICVDLNKGLVFYYDHDYWANPLKWQYDPYAPYRGVIVFCHGSEGEDEKVIFGTRYGSFHYDASGILRTIRGGSLIQNEQHEFEFNVPEVILQRTEQGGWKLLRNSVEDILLGEEELVLFRSKITEPAAKLIRNGQRLVKDEIATTLMEEGGRMRFHQKTLAGHKQKIIEVPAAIDIPTWRSTFDRRDGGWIQVLSRFPSSIELQV